MKKLFTLFAVAAMALAAQANVLTVCDGDAINYLVPINGWYVDQEGTMAQMIYPADMLTEMQNGKITQVKFYPEETIEFENCELELSFKTVDQIGFETTTAVTGATVVAAMDVMYGRTELVFDLYQPYEYTGGNLMVEVNVSIEGDYNYTSTYFLGVNTEYNASMSHYMSYGTPSDVLHQFLPKCSFIYEPGEVTPVEPTEKTDAPSSAKENYVYNDGNLYYNAYTVNLIPTEPSTIYYRVGILVDGEYEYGEWMEYTGELNFDDEGTYMIEAYAIADGKTESDHIWDGFTVSKMVDVEELFAGKTVANVRYYNLAGQEMQQANGLTIMVTTFTDGTQSAVKVVK